MLTTDLSLRFDPAYEKISRRFHEHPEQFADAFARAWFKLTHRDMGPRRALSGQAGAEGNPDLAGPDPGRRSSADRRCGRRGAQSEAPGVGPVGLRACFNRLGLGLDLPRLGQARRRQWRAHPSRAAEGLGGQQPAAVGQVLAQARRRSRRTSTRRERRQEGVAGRPDRARRRARRSKRRRKDAGVDVEVPFTPGRMDATQEQTDADPSRRWSRSPTVSATIISGKSLMAPEEALVDRAQLLTLTGPEMTVLVGGLRVLGANAGGSQHGVFTDRAGHADQRLLRQPARHGRRSGSRRRRERL